MERSSRAIEGASRGRRYAAWVVGLVALVSACSKPRAGSGGGDAGGGGARSGEPLRVAAASDLAWAFEEVGRAFEATSGKKVSFSFGSSGLFAKQIAEGAPFDVYAAANVSYVDDVVRAGACLGETKASYAEGRLALWSSDAKHAPKDLAELKDKRFAKISIANPEHAPYGVAAREALAASGAWTSVEPRMVYGENVQQALVFAQSGNADVAVIALSLALKSKGTFVPIDPKLHKPLDQALVVCRGGASGEKLNEARSFVDFVRSERGRTILRAFGFLLPGESVPNDAPKAP